MHRCWLDILRNPLLVLLQSLLMVGFGVFGGLVFRGMSLDTSGAQNRGGLFFFASAFTAFTSLTAVDSILRQHHVLIWEMTAQLYHPLELGLAYLTVDTLFLRCLPVACFAAPLYFLAGLSQEWVAILYFFGTLIVFASAVAGLSLTLSLLFFGSPPAANLLLVVVLLVLMMFNGFLVNVDRIAPWIGWIHFLSPFYYFWEGSMSSEFRGLSIQLEAAGFQVTDVPGSTFVLTLGLSMDHELRNAAILSALYVGTGLLFCAGLWYRIARIQAGTTPQGVYRVTEYTPTGAL